MSGSDHQLGVPVCRTDNVLLLDGHTLRGKFHAQVTARYHHAVHHIQDRLEILQGFRLFQLGNQQRRTFAAANTLYRLMHPLDLAGCTHKRDRHRIHIL